MRRELAVGADNKTGPAALSARAVSLTAHVGKLGSKSCDVHPVRGNSGTEGAGATSVCSHGVIPLLVGF